MRIRRYLIAVVCMFALFSAAPAQAGWRDYVSPSKNWHRLKHCCSAAVGGVKNYCHKKVETARANQEKLWGLKVPANLDESKPLVVLIHGLNSDSGVWTSMAKLLETDGKQVAYFNFPGDGPINEDGQRLAKEMAALHQAMPRLRVDFIAHSMGGLVARSYLESDGYTQNVDHFISIAPPNHGSPWARERFLLEIHENYWQWRTNKNWSPIWMFTDGLGEAGDDLKPGSAFLKSLNAKPRREGVKYTIIAGNHHILNRMGAGALLTMEKCFTTKVWGLRQCHTCIEFTETKLVNQTNESDGVVPLESARLKGVSDIVILHADHNALAMETHGAPPAAWGVIKARLDQ
jgi:pimeloyl-ACP methyl ester carboxylesterase